MRLIENLNLKYLDPIEVDIIDRETNKVLYTYTRPLQKSENVCIRYHIVGELDLKSTDVIQVDIRRGK